MFSGQDPEPRPQTPRLYNSTKLAHGASLICSISQEASGKE